MSTAVVQHGTSWRAAAVTVASVLIVAVTLTWMYLSMRAVMGVGGACADGGPYVSAQPCPDGSVLIAPAAPLMIIFSMIGTVSASQVGAPNLLVPMWGVLFGSLGWNFLEFTFTGPDVVWGWLVCGVMFWAMALPALALMLSGLRASLAKPTAGRAWMWLPAYGVLGALGLSLGWASYVAVAG
jgi:hypothetical protein